jgi:hypothetical protein
MAELRVCAPPARTVSSVGVVRQVLPDFLHSVVRRAAASARPDMRPSVAQPLVSVMEPDADPLSARARPAVENREMA